MAEPLKDCEGRRIFVGDILGDEANQVRVVRIEPFPLTLIATLEWLAGNDKGKTFQLNKHELSYGCAWEKYST